MTTTTTLRDIAEGLKTVPRAHFDCLRAYISDDSRVRKNVVFILGHFAHESKLIIPVLIHALTDNEDDIGRRAIGSLTKFYRAGVNLSSAMDAIRTAASTKQNNPNTQYRARELLLAMGEEVPEDHESL